VIDLILIGGVVILLNVLDSVTSVLIDRLPEYLRAGEANPFMVGWLEKYPKGSHIFKQLAVIAVVAFLIVAGDMRFMVVPVVILGLVVVNNSYIWIGRSITKRKIHTPFYKACKASHIPENRLYFVWVVVTVPMAVAIGFLLF
jgi:hypothetical protein